MADAAASSFSKYSSSVSFSDEQHRLIDQTSPATLSHLKLVVESLRDSDQVTSWLSSGEISLASSSNSINWNALLCNLRIYESLEESSVLILTFKDSAFASPSFTSIIPPSFTIR